MQAGIVNFIFMGLYEGVSDVFFVFSIEKRDISDSYSTCVDLT